jgi:hypothetical protein
MTGILVDERGGERPSMNLQVVVQCTFLRRTATKTNLSAGLNQH